MSKAKKEVIEKIFYVSKELEELKTILCADGGKRYKELNYIIARISDIIDFTNSKKREIFNEKEEVITSDNEYIGPIGPIGSVNLNLNSNIIYTPPDFNVNEWITRTTSITSEDETLWATPF